MNGIKGVMLKKNIINFIWLASFSGCFSGCGDDKVNVTPAISVSPTTGLTTTEAGGQALFSVSLGSAPTAPVTIDLTSSDTSEGTVSPATLTFTKDNFAAPQVVTVTGVNDMLADGNVAYVVKLAPTVSTDKTYKGLDPADVMLSNIDNETAGVTVTPIAGLRTTEAGGTSTFSIVLNSQPAGDVTIPVASADATEGTAAPASVTFTSLNWAAPQIITVTGVDDTEADGEVVFTVAVGATASADASYNGINPPDVTLANVDNDTAGVTVQPTSGLVVNEGGGTASFKITLNTQPTADVVVPLTSSDAGEATVSPSSLTFTSVNWKAPQTATITGVNDDIADGNQSFMIVVGPATSVDLAYNANNPADVTGINQDNDSPGFVFAPLTPLVTSEDGGQVTFTVALQSKPSAPVTVALSSSKPTEGTVAPVSVSFTVDNWNAPQTVTVKGVNDEAADGNQPYSIITEGAVSDDVGYKGLNPLDIAVTNNDNDTPVIIVAAAANLATTEAGGTATFTVRLQTKPSASVTIAVSSTDPFEGTVSAPQLVFTDLNWSGLQTVTVTGVNDDDADGNQVYKVILGAAVSPDASYNGKDPIDVDLSNTDNDSVGVTVTPTTGLVTTESGGQATFSVVLKTRPLGDVTFNVASSRPTEGTVSAGTVSFSATAWNSPKTITITGINDDAADGNQPYTIVIGPGISNADSKYNGIDPDDVTVSNTDNDTAGFTVTPKAGLVTTEQGGQAKFTIRLNTRPTGNVKVTFTSSDLTEGTVTPAEFTFTPENWDGLQDIVITGVGDAIFDGDQSFTIVTSEAVSTDGSYSGKNPDDVSVINDDADPGVRVTPVAISTTEVGGTATFAVVLNTKPAANVTISITSAAVEEGLVDKAELLFTADNWFSAQIVTVTGQDDQIADGNVAYVIVTGRTASPDATYNSLPVDDVTVTNVDNESAGITVAPTTGLQTKESGTTAKFTVVLNSQPTAPVTIGLEVGDLTEGSLNRAALVFSETNWSAPQTVTITGLNDNLADGLQGYLVKLLPAASTDVKYALFDATDVSVTNVDDETAGFTVSPSVLVTNEAQTLTPRFSVVLNSQPTEDVSIAVSSSNTAEGTVDLVILKFTKDTWPSPQFVTVRGEDDVVQDGDRAYSIILSPATSLDPGYNKLDPADVVVTNIDNDTAGVIVTANNGLQTGEEGGKAVFTVALRTQPTANVTIALRSGDITEGSVSTALLTFTAANWNSAQEVTVTGVNDEVADGDQVFDIIIDPSQSTDPNYVGKKDRNVQITNIDNEQPGFDVAGYDVEGGLQTDETGKQATFTVRLLSEPTADVTVSLSVNNAEATVSSPKLTFTSTNWKGLQTVTVTGADDFVKDGNKTFTIITAAAESADVKYNGVDPKNVIGTNSDNDSAGVNLVVDEAITVNEDGTKTATFYVTLKSQPAAPVTIPTIVVSDATEAVVDVTSIVINPADWSGRKAIKVTGVNDEAADGNQQFNITFGALMSLDADYSGRTIPPVPGTTLDDETAGVILTPTTGLVTNENGATASFKVRLQSRPSENVVVSFAVNNGAEVETPASVSFLPAEWDVAKNVTVKGKNDDIADGNQAFVITASSEAATDVGYKGKTWNTVSGMNQDDETPNFTISRTRGLVTSEAGTKDTFTVVLASRPKANVTITLSGNTAEGTLSVATLTFTKDGDNWKTPQTVEVTGVDDAVKDGSQPYLIIVSPATSADTDYAARPSQTVEVTNSDND